MQEYKRFIVEKFSKRVGRDISGFISQDDDVLFEVDLIIKICQEMEKGELDKWRMAMRVCDKYDFEIQRRFFEAVQVQNLEHNYILHPKPQPQTPQTPFVLTTPQTKIPKGSIRVILSKEVKQKRFYLRVRIQSTLPKYTPIDFVLDERYGLRKGELCITSQDCTFVLVMRGKMVKNKRTSKNYNPIPVFGRFEVDPHFRIVAPMVYDSPDKDFLRRALNVILQKSDSSYSKYVALHSMAKSKIQPYVDRIWLFVENTLYQDNPYFQNYAPLLMQALFLPEWMWEKTFEGAPQFVYYGFGLFFIFMDALEDYTSKIYTKHNIRRCVQKTDQIVFLLRMLFNGVGGKRLVPIKEFVFQSIERIKKSTIEKYLLSYVFFGLWEGYREVCKRAPDMLERSFDIYFTKNQKEFD